MESISFVLIHFYILLLHGAVAYKQYVVDFELQATILRLETVIKKIIYTTYQLSFQQNLKQLILLIKLFSIKP